MKSFVPEIKKSKSILCLKMVQWIVGIWKRLFSAGGFLKTISNDDKVVTNF